MTDTETMTLTDFLEARIGEDECLAREVLAADKALRDSGTAPKIRVWHTAAMRHLQSWAPDRVLAECAAKRQIIELHRLVTEDEHSPLTWPPKKVTGCDACRLAGPDGDLRVDDGPCPTLRLLALPYADHEDYRDEWRLA